MCRKSRSISMDPVLGVRGRGWQSVAKKRKKGEEGKAASGASDKEYDDCRCSSFNDFLLLIWNLKADGDAQVPEGLPQAQNCVFKKKRES